MKTTQWKEKITEWLNAKKLKKSSFLLVECKDCKMVSFSRVSFLLGMFAEKRECHSCKCKYWRLKTENLGGWKRSAKCQVGLLSADKDMKFNG